MDSTNRLQHNVKLLQERYSHYAQAVMDQNPESLEWCETRQGEPNLSDSTAPSTRHIHSSYSAEKETEKWLADLGFDSLKNDCNVLYLYGVGLGYSFDPLASWLSESSDRYLVYLEDDLRVIRRLLETERGTKILESQQVLVVYTGKGEDDLEEVCEDLTYYFVKLPAKVTALPCYQKHKEEQFRDLQMRLMHKTVYISYGSEEFLRYGCKFYKNYYRNLQFLPGSIRASGLYGKFEGIPAIICGAGPSLDKNFEILRQLDRRALVFAGGSAINALTNRGLVPHYGATVDPNHEQYKRMSSQSGFTLPFFYKGRTYYQVLPSLSGQRILLPGNTGYPASSWVEKQLGITEPFIREGHNVLHLSIDLARMMGCNPIIFVGMDLAYTDMQLYASDVVGEAKVSEKELTAATDLNNNSFLRDDIYGKPVYTLWKWVAESHYTSKYAKSFPEVTFINATEGGLGFEGIVNMPLAHVKERYLKEEHDLRAWVSGLIEQSRYDISIDEVKEVLGELKESLHRCKQHTDTLAESFSALKDALMAQQFQEVQELSTEIEVRQVELGREVAQVQVLAPVNHIRSILFERKTTEISCEGDQTREEEIAAHCDANREEMQSLSEAARLNLELLTEALELYS
ncbi:Uncharacterized protein SCG7086_BR_00050 [Chlamydiales bacterium SCGC AG-110-P3]|nr:Uncharacterized protein SCG7086_BR_00050 [Chlamydiales bacterium SCGC AG-110-P3]